MNIGLIGCGNMGSAIIGGMLRAGAFMASDIYVYDIDDHKTHVLHEETGVNVSASIETLCRKSDAVIVAVKPHQIEDILINHHPILENRIIISIAAGVTVASYRRYLKKAKIARVMPNTPALVGEGASGVYFDGDFDENEHPAIIHILESLGIVEEIAKESLMDVVTGLSGSGPAYVFAFINSLADGAVMEGLPRETARKLAIRTVLGAAKLAQTAYEDGVHLEELKDRVTSPGGTTAQGLKALEQHGFRGAVIEAVSSAANRARELGKGESST